MTHKSRRKQARKAYLDLLSVSKRLNHIKGGRFELRHAAGHVDIALMKRHGLRALLRG